MSTVIEAHRFRQGTPLLSSDMSRGDMGESSGGPLLTASSGRSPEPVAGSPLVSLGDYAPSPNTSSQAVNRANQLLVQNLLRRLLLEPDENVRIDTVRVLRRTLREIDYQLGWLTQVDFLETIERLLRNEQHQQQRRGQPPTGSPVNQQRLADGSSDDQSSLELSESGPDTSWRLVHDATQLLIESVPRLDHEIDQQLIEAIVPSVVENLGHQRSEVRRSSLLLLNLLLNEQAQYFKLLIRLFIDYGLTNYRNKQAQRGAILSLPLLISEPIVDRGEDLTPLVRCLSELLLIDSNEQLFYSLFLAMQRVHLMIGDQEFQTILRRCEPEAAHLYKQAASRNNSLVLTDSCGPTGSAGPDLVQFQRRKPSSSGGAVKGTRRGSRMEEVDKEGPTVGQNHQRHEQQASEQVGQEQQARQHVTFESSDDNNFEEANIKTGQAAGELKPEASSSDQDNQQQAPLGQAEGSAPGESRVRVRPDSQLSSATSESLSLCSSSAASDQAGTLAASSSTKVTTARRQYSSDVSSTCSSDAHLVNPAHYMTKAALAGNPLDHYEEIHHVDHSNVTGLAINDFGPICNTPTIEFSPQLSSGIQASLGQHLRASHQCESPAAAMALLSSELKFGIFPRHLIQVTLHSPRPADRYEAMQELMCIIRESPINHLAILMTYFDSFLEQFLSKVLLSPRQHQQQTDCKLELVGIDMIETIIIKTKVSTMQFIRPIVSLLMRALAIDAQRDKQDHQEQLQRIHPTIFRENTCRVLHKMMAYLPPQHVIDAIFEHKHQKCSVVREEAINRVTAAILEYDRNEFNLTKLCYHVLPMLADQSASVRLASLECIATLAHVLGPERIGSLLTAAEAVQTGCDYDGLLDAINARLMRHTLSRCQSNGIVRYALKPFLAHHQLQGSGANSTSSLAADVRWVLESPSLHHHHHHHDDYNQQQHHHHNNDVYQQPTGSQHEANTNGHHQHHRLGVYSPPARDERRRRSSVGVTPHDLIGSMATAAADDKQNHQHHHDHHQHHHKSASRHSTTSTSDGHQQQQQQQSEQQEQEADLNGEQVEDEPPSTGQQQAKQCNSSSSDQRARDSTKRPSATELDNSENHRRQSTSGAARKPSGLTSQPATKPDTSKTSTTGARRKSQAQAVSVAVATDDGGHHVPSSKRRGSNIAMGTPPVARAYNRAPPSGHQDRHERTQPQKAASYQQPVRRSNSQDSLSSTDTNKVLFQFYLGKFKQSLANNSPGNQYQAVLPSDSIIYTDISQAYELSRHQSRFQQTSFDYDRPIQRSSMEEPAPGRHGINDSQQLAGPTTGGTAGVASSRRSANVNHDNTATTKQTSTRQSQSQENEPVQTGRKRSSAGRMASEHQLGGVSQDAATVGKGQERHNTRHGSLASKQHHQVAAEEQANETSGSESPQTIRDARVDGAGPKSRPSMQRQPTVGRGGVDADQHVGGGEESPANSLGQRRRQSSPANQPPAESRRSASSGGSVRRKSVAAPQAEVGNLEHDGAKQQFEQRQDRQEAAEGQDESGAFVAERRQSQSVSKRSSDGDSQAGPPSAGSVGAQQTQARRQSSVDSAEGGSKRSQLQRQESEATTVSSQATSSMSSAVVAERTSTDQQRAVRRRSVSQRRKTRSRPSTSAETSAELNQDQDETLAAADDDDGHEEREARRRASRSQPPVARHHSRQEAQHQDSATEHSNPKAACLIRVRHHSNHVHPAQHGARTSDGALGLDASGRACSVSPGLSNSVNIRHILENVAQSEGPFAEPQLAFKVAMSALDSACWSTKVEGLLALIRIVAHHGELAEHHLHEIVARTGDETRNLRSTVARAAIFALGDYCARLKRNIEPEMDLIVKALLNKSLENTAFIRDDIKRALGSMVDHLTPWRLATLLINQGGQHKSVHVRRMTSQFVALTLDRMGTAKALVGAREISHLLLPAAARFAQDQSPHTRYYGRLMLSKLMHHSSFERLLRRNLPSTLYRSTIGVIESVKRRGCGAPPPDA